MSFASLLINETQSKLLSTVGITFVILGTVGNLSNIILFTRRPLRQLSPCITFLLAASIANVADIYPYILLHTLYGFNITPAYYSSAVCKLQLYLYYTSFCTSSWFMVGCCADRFFSSSSSARIRRYHCTRTTGRIILAITIVILLVYSQVLFCYEANQLNQPAPCFLRSSMCNMFDIASYFIFQSFGPPICMLIFGIGTFIHIRQGQQIRQQPINVDAIATIPIQIINARKNNRNILPMLIVQITLYILCSLPLMFFKIYSNLPWSTIKNDTQLSVENLILNVAILLSFVDKIFSFYIYTLTSAYFRAEIIKLFTQRGQIRRVVPAN